LNKRGPAATTRAAGALGPPDEAGSALPFTPVAAAAAGSAWISVLIVEASEPAAEHLGSTAAFFPFLGKVGGMGSGSTAAFLTFLAGGAGASSTSFDAAAPGPGSVTVL
jgi:hypothetical protein